MRIPLADWKRAVAEQASLRGRFVDNLYQTGPRTFLLRLDPGKVPLVIDLAPGRARALVTDAPPATPEEPPVLAQILRKALRGARFLGAALLSEDRIVGFDFDTAEGPRRLVVEAFPRHGNLLLLDEEGTILRVLDGEASKRRDTPVGARYRLPAPPPPRDDPSLLPDGLPEGPFAANLHLDRLAREEEAAAPPGDGEAKERERAIERLRRTVEAVRRDLAALPDPLTIRAQGEILLGHYGELRQGMKEFRGIPLDPKLPPQENVELLFQSARKAGRARPVLEARLAELTGLLARAEAGEELPRSLIEPVRRGRPEPRLPFKTFLSADGRRILVGKGGSDNDELTLRVAGPNDIFLHVRGTPGAHVIVPLDKGQEIPDATLLDAATLALHYSKSRNAAAADITWTPRRNVSKPKGAKPGLVQVREERVLRLRREPARLARILATAGGEEE